MALYTYKSELTNLIQVPRSKIVTFIVSQLDYWFSKMGNKFYKFIEPSSNQKSYKEGDSWTEELCISRKTFTRAFDKIGTRHKSKSSFRDAKDKFQGKPYASYYDRQTKKTVFLKNSEISLPKLKCIEKNFEPTNQILENISHSNLTSSSIKKLNQHDKPSNTANKPRNIITQKSKAVPKTFNAQIQNAIKINKEISFKIKTRPNTNGSEAHSQNNIPFYNGHFGRSGYIYKYIYLTKTTPSKQASNLNQTKKIEQSDQSELVRILKNIWIEKIGEEEKTLQTSPKTILKAFWEIFNGSVEKWKEYCIKIASSDFLMGRIKNTFKIWISWALKKETYDRINSGDLGVLKTEYIKTTLETNEVLNSILLNHSEKNIRDSLQELSKRIDPTTFKSWFKEAIVQKTEGNIAFLRVKDRLASDYVRKNFSSELAFCFNKFNPEIKRVEIFS